MRLSMSNFFNELKKRNVYKVATAYVITAVSLAEIVDIIGPNLGWPSSIESWLIRILIVGFPMALVLAWLYELTPKGFKRTGSEQQDTADNRKAGKRLNYLIIGVLAVTICFMLVERIFFAGNTNVNPQQEASIAVLPFVNMSTSEDHEAFADGLTEEILNKLAQINGLQVPARTSSFKFKDKNEDVRSIGKDLSVNYLLEGSIQFDETQNRIKITAQLINTNNGYHLWSDIYEDDFKEIFAIQEDVSNKVASQLRLRILPQNKEALTTRSTENTEAYKLFVEARGYIMKRNAKYLKKAIELLNKALDLDPNFAEAHAELSFTYGLMEMYANMGPKERDELMQFHTEKAIELAPEKPEVLRAKAWAEMHNREFEQATADLRKALQVNPNYADAYYLLGLALPFLGDRKSGLEALKKAAELDPIGDYTLRYTYAVWTLDQDHEKALATLEKIIQRDSSANALKRKSWIIKEAYGDLVQSFILMHEASKEDPSELYNLQNHLYEALDLDLLPVAEKNARIARMRYPENQVVTYPGTRDLYYFKNEESKLREWIEFWAAEKDLVPWRIDMDKVELPVYLGNYTKALTTFKETYPEIPETKPETLEIDGENAIDFAYYTELLRLVGEDQLADTYAKVVCEFYNSSPVDRILPQNQKYNQLLDCYYLTNDTTRFLKTLEERYFIKQDRANVLTKLRIGRYQRGKRNMRYRRFEDHPKYQDLVSRITEDIHRQRAEVIEYLKEEGDWDPAWDKELGLD
jgi:TolB-like protein